MIQEGKKCQGTTFVVPQNDSENELGFSPSTMSNCD
jgi:hypothetical protein